MRTVYLLASGQQCLEQVEGTYACTAKGVVNQQYEDKQKCTGHDKTMFMPWGVCINQRDPVTSELTFIRWSPAGVCSNPYPSWLQGWPAPAVEKSLNATCPVLSNLLSSPSYNLTTRTSAIDTASCAEQRKSTCADAVTTLDAHKRAWLNMSCSGCPASYPYLVGALRVTGIATSQSGKTSTEYDHNVSNAAGKLCSDISNTPQLVHRGRTDCANLCVRHEFSVDRDWVNGLQQAMFPRSASVGCYNLPTCPQHRTAPLVCDAWQADAECPKEGKKLATVTCSAGKGCAYSSSYNASAHGYSNSSNITTVVACRKWCRTVPGTGCCEFEVDENKGTTIEYTCSTITGMAVERDSEQDSACVLPPPSSCSGCLLHSTCYPASQLPQQACAANGGKWNGGARRTATHPRPTAPLIAPPVRSGQRTGRGLTRAAARRLVFVVVPSAAAVAVLHVPAPWHMPLLLQVLERQVRLREL